jgi:hypothetical protein
MLGAGTSKVTLFWPRHRQIEHVGAGACACKGAATGADGSLPSPNMLGVHPLHPPTLHLKTIWDSINFQDHGFQMIPCTLDSDWCWSL